MAEGQPRDVLVFMAKLAEQAERYVRRKNLPIIVPAHGHLTPEWQALNHTSIEQLMTGFACQSYGRDRCIE